MWPNNSFGNTGPFQNSFNPDEFTPPFAAGPSAGQPFFSHQLQHQPHPMQYEDDSDDNYITNDFQPEVGLYNESAYMQNQFNSPNNQVSIMVF
jgi:hypothetical protein